MEQEMSSGSSTSILGMCISLLFLLFSDIFFFWIHFLLFSTLSFLFIIYTLFYLYTFFFSYIHSSFLYFFFNGFFSLFIVF